MIQEKLSGEDILQLHRQKGSVCVSVIVPTHRLSPERRGDQIETEKAVKEAKELLRYKYRHIVTEDLEQGLDDLVRKVDFNHNEDGLGLFVSADTKMLVRFPFPVEKKVMADQHFGIRDLLYKINHEVPYLVLLLSNKEVKLFRGTGDRVEEIRDTYFPAEFHDDYEYSPPSRGHSRSGYTHVKDFEKDKNQLFETRIKAFYRESGQMLKEYLEKDIPLILAGPEKELVLFGEVFPFTNRVIHRYKGNYLRYNSKMLADLVWPAMEMHLLEERSRLLNEFTEILGARQGVSGIHEAWLATVEGKAYKLLVEKDYRVPGFVIDGDPKLHLVPPIVPHRILADAVDELIGMVLEKKGQVYFLENGKLKDWQHIALITRY